MRAEYNEQARYFVTKFFFNTLKQRLITRYFKMETTLFTIFNTFQYNQETFGHLFLKFLNNSCYTENLHKTNSPSRGGVVTLKTGRREVPGSNPGRACRLSRSEFSAVFSETGVNID